MIRYIYSSNYFIFIIITFYYHGIYFTLLFTFCIIIINRNVLLYFVLQILISLTLFILTVLFCHVFCFILLYSHLQNDGACRYPQGIAHLLIS